MKNWRTTLAGVIGVVLMALGIFLPEKFDPETNAQINSALNEILVGVGGLISVISNIVAKDPVPE